MFFPVSLFANLIASQITIKTATIYPTAFKTSMITFFLLSPIIDKSTGG